MSQRGRRREREGVVTSNRMEKTVVVSVTRTVRHSKYKKYLKRRTRIKAHDEQNGCQLGDRVLIVECRPISREKRWRVSRILARAVVTEEDESATSEASPAV